MKISYQIDIAYSIFFLEIRKKNEEIRNMRTKFNLRRLRETKTYANVKGARVTPAAATFDM